LGDELLVGRIVETEAYMGSDDPASHAFRGVTERNRSMFMPGGYLYVYRSYGIHNCANVVTGEADAGMAVLLRAVEPITGTEAMRRRRSVDADRRLAAGPGRLCEAFGIDGQNDGQDLLDDSLFIARATDRPKIGKTERIGISVATERQWRFVEVGSRYLSRSYRGKDF
jgi:DNA-3-methyladenine glycosylase